MSNQRWAYYNEHDAFAADWLRELMKDGLIAEGEVDQRSIEDVTPNDIRSFRQCHFFAGIGVWSIAARLAGWEDDAPLWTGSCPCQPFSAAGKGEGFADERHLWPAFHYLIEQCRPSLVAGEQVTGADGDAWFDLVSADLDATGYAFGVAETCAAGFGAPHERSRNYWVGVAAGVGCEGRGDEPEHLVTLPAGEGAVRLAYAIDDGQREHGHRLGGTAGAGEGELPGGAQRLRADPADGGAAGGLADADRDGQQPGGLPVRQGRPREGALIEHWRGENGWLAAGRGRNSRPGPVNGFWSDADWLRCRDEPVPKWRPVEPGTFPLVDAGTFRNRVGLLRGAGNAITIGQAQGFLIAVRQALAL